MNNRSQNVLVTDANNVTTPLQERPTAGAQADQPQPALQGSANADCDLWRNYWRTRKQPWRTEPEIEAKRQVELDQYMATLPDIEQGRYPLKDIQLRRADIEWLLATHQSLQDSLDEHDRPQRMCDGPDLRGADLRRARLRFLPLSGMYGGLPGDEWLLATDMQRDMAAVRLERAELCGVHLEGAILCGAHLEEADLRDAHLEGADLRGAYLAGANLSGAHLEGAILCQAHLEGEQNFPRPANLRRVFLDNRTRLEGIILGNDRYGFTPLADVHWGNVNLAEVDWTQIDKSGDEYEVQWKLPGEYQYAIRANRQLAVVLRTQGLHADADHFAYRAYVNQRSLHLQQAILPIVLRVFMRERMPLPKVLLRLEERRQGQRMSRRPLRSALIRLIPLLLMFLVVALLQPLALIALLALCTLLFLSVLPTMRKRRLRPLQYRRSQRPVPPPGLLSQPQRRRQQWLLLLGFLLGMPKSELPVLLGPPSVALPRVPLLRRLKARWRNHPLPFIVVASFLIPLLLLDDTLVCYGRYLFSLLLDVLTGYGYKPWRSFSWYLVVVFGVAALYYVSGHPQAAFLLSLTSFHGYGFFVENTHALGSLVSTLAVLEAIIGLIIEVCFIATMTRRFLGK
ncbi:MAG: pentapeptide repeat-containing protein [Ktedonobacteraceae bacterium]